MNPLISIIMPAYNRSSVITNAIDSIMRQTYTNWELIVVDDRSTDNTKDVIEKLTIVDSRIKYVVNNRSKGPGGARNFGMLYATGEFLSFLDSDDQWFEDHLQHSLDTIQRTNADVSFALWVEQHGPTRLHNFDNEVEQELIGKMRKLNRVDGDAIVFKERLFEQFLSHTRNFFQLNTMLFKRELIQKYGLINEEFYLGEDTTFIIRFFDHCTIALITKPQSVYFQSPDSVYFFCDRWKLDPDLLHKNNVVLDKFEALGLKSVQVRLHIMDRVIEDKQLTNKKACIQNIKIGIAKKYYTLSYINRYDREKAIRYCRQSLKYKVSIFNLTLLLRLFLSIKSGSGFLKKAVDLW
ncbi:glycosyltransferase family 2 protein [Paenibacillus sp. GSMTC-2017]|nr:glycosyltransferase family 2 protein [Paenibacillus sp. GSMTC-2017]